MLIINPWTTEYSKVPTSTVFDWRAQLMIADCFCMRVFIICFQFYGSTSMFIAQEVVLSHRKGQCDEM
jgi:hypothetical protein